jgi:hypothetical protein
MHKIQLINVKISFNVSMFKQIYQIYQIFEIRKEFNYNLF